MTPPKKFYASAEAKDGRILLDGKPANTPKRKPLTLPQPALADAVAAEWNAQEKTIDPDSMPLTRLAAIAIDIISSQREAIVEDLVSFSDTDLLYHRSDDQALAALQMLRWDEVLHWVHRRYDIQTHTTVGVMPIEQPPAVRVAIKKILDGLDDFHLAGIAAVTQLAGSVWLALALHEKILNAEEILLASYVDEDFQTEQWGLTDDQEEKRALLQGELGHAERFFQLLKPKS